MLVKMDAANAGGGQNIIVVDITNVANDTYYFAIFDGKDYWTASIPYTDTTTVVTHGNISFQQTATHTFVFTALNGARLYELSSFTDYGVNGSATVGSLYANTFKVYASVNGELTQN